MAVRPLAPARENPGMPPSASTSDLEPLFRQLSPEVAALVTAVDSVVHLAAYFDFSGEDNPLYQKVNVDGTRALLRALQGFEVEQFVYSGMMLVHEPAAVTACCGERC